MSASTAPRLPVPDPTFTDPMVPDSPATYARHLATCGARQTKGERTRAQIQVAACRILDDNEPRELTVAAVCRLAGVSNGTFYIYFPDRIALLDTLLTGFVEFLQASMRAASAGRPGDATRAATRAYVEMFSRNRGLMRCLVHHLDNFPEAQAAFQRLNREWIETVVASVRRRMRRQGREDAIPRPELIRRAYALGGMVDQYLSSLLLSQDPALAAVSQDRDQVVETLSLIWERGLAE